MGTSCEDREVMELFKDCLQQLYRVAGLDYPEEFDPDIESSRIAAALVGKGLTVCVPKLEIEYRATS